MAKIIYKIFFIFILMIIFPFWTELFPFWTGKGIDIILMFTDIIIFLSFFFFFLQPSLNSESNRIQQGRIIMHSF